LNSSASSRRESGETFMHQRELSLFQGPMRGRATLVAVFMVFLLGFGFFCSVDDALAKRIAARRGI